MNNTTQAHHNSQQPTSSSRFFIIYVAALTAFAPFSTDIYLASMPILQTLFATTAAHVQFTLSGFFVGFAVMQLIWGPLSDRIGRRSVVLIGVSIFIVGSILCAISQTIMFLIVSRIIQAIGACAGVVMALAIIKDKFPNKEEMTSILSVMMSIAVLAPMIAPIIGSYLLAYFGWRSNFYFLTTYGVVLILATLCTQDSYPKALRKPLPLNRLCQAYAAQLKCWHFVLGGLAVGTNFSVLFTFISGSAFIYINLYHVEPHLFGYLFAINAAGLSGGSLITRRWRHVLTDKQLVWAPIILITISAITMMLLLWHYPNQILCVIVPSFFVSVGVIMLLPQLTSLALQHVVAYTGLASSLLGTARFVLAAITGALMGMLITTTAMPLAVMMLSLNTITGLLMLGYFKMGNGRS